MQSIPKAVAYLSGNGNYTWMHYPDGRKELIAFTMKRMLDERYPDLIRIHKQTAVNPAYVREWRLLASIKLPSTALLKLGDSVLELTISRERREHVYDFLNAPRKTTEYVLPGTGTIPRF